MFPKPKATVSWVTYSVKNSASYPLYILIGTLVYLTLMSTNNGGEKRAAGLCQETVIPALHKPHQ